MLRVKPKERMCVPSWVIFDDRVIFDALFGFAGSDSCFDVFEDGLRVDIQSLSLIKGPPKNFGNNGRIVGAQAQTLFV